MNKTKLLAVFLSLALVLSGCACGNAATSDENVAHNHATEITTEFVTETEVAEVHATETVDSTGSTSASDATEKLDTEMTTEVDVAENDTESSNKKEDNKTENTDKKNPSNGSNTGSNNSGNNSSNTGGGTGNGNSGNGSTGGNTSKPGTDTEAPTPTERPADTEKGPEEAESTEKPAPDTEAPKPTEPATCQHTNVGYAPSRDGITHDIICDDCFFNKGEFVVLGSEPCDFTGGACKCGLACSHTNPACYVKHSDESRDGRCGFTCTACGFTSLLPHEILNDVCGRCGRVFPCLHLYTSPDLRGSTADYHTIRCRGCDATVGTEPHVFVNGYCACGRPESAPPETEAPAPPPETETPGNDTEVPAPVIEDGVTSEEVAKMWKHICNHHR